MASLSTTMAPRVRGTTAGAAGTFYITGLQASTARLMNKATSVQADSVKATDDAADEIARAQRASAPVASGKTRDSITNEASWEGADYSRSVGPTHYVARYLVFGTVRMSRKWNLFAASQPGIDSWMDAMQRVAGDV